MLIQRLVGQGDEPANQEPEKPLVDQLENIKGTITEFVNKFGDVFDTERLQKAIDDMETNKKDFYQIQIDLTMNSIKALNEAMLTMVKVRTTVSSMVEVLSSQINTVTQIYNEYKKVVDNLTKDQKKQVFLVSVETLDKMLIGAIDQVIQSKNDLQSVQESMTATSTNFEALIQYAEKAKDENSPERKNMWGQLGKAFGHCITECIQIVTCASCLAIDINAQNKEFDRIINNAQVKQDMMTKTFKAFEDTCQSLAKKAEDDKEALNTFAVEAQKMETEIKANQALSFLDSAMERIASTLAPLKQQCDVLLAKFKSTEKKQNFKMIYY